MPGGAIYPLRGMKGKYGVNFKKQLLVLAVWILGGTWAYQNQWISIKRLDNRWWIIIRLGWVYFTCCLLTFTFLHSLPFCVCIVHHKRLVKSPRSISTGSAGTACVTTLQLPASGLPLVHTYSQWAFVYHQGVAAISHLRTRLYIERPRNNWRRRALVPIRIIHIQHAHISSHRQSRSWLLKSKYALRVYCVPLMPSWTLSGATSRLGWFWEIHDTEGEHSNFQ